MTDGARSTEAMRLRWNRFAADNPLYFACTNDLAADSDAFYESGRLAVDRALQWLGDRGDRDRLLEIGCGPGRTVLHFASHFGHVDAIDISPEMIRVARDRCGESNVTFHAGTGADLSPIGDRSIGLVYSSLMFQHIPDEAIIASYLHEIHRVLAPNGAAILQFDTRPMTPMVRMSRLLPDLLFPRTRRRYIRRYRRDASRLLRMFHDARLDVIDQRGMKTAEHEFMLQATVVDVAGVSNPH